MAVFDHLRKVQPADKLYPVFVDPESGTFNSGDFLSLFSFYSFSIVPPPISTDLVTIGALADSFYEYLLKYWLLTGKTDAALRQWYYDTADGILKELSKPFHQQEDHSSDLLYLTERKGGRLDNYMDHLACFSSGMYALGAENERATDQIRAARHLKAAVALGDFCHLYYSVNESGLTSDSYAIVTSAGKERGGKAAGGKEKKSKHELQVRNRPFEQRPESIESWFVLWRLTGDGKYRQYAWDYFQSIERYTKCKYGYSGVRDATADVSKLMMDDVQKSFFLAETLKYLYLIFSPPSLVPLDRFVFNTEAHPFPVYTS